MKKTKLDNQLKVIPVKEKTPRELAIEDLLNKEIEFTKLTIREKERVETTHLLNQIYSLLKIQTLLDY